MNELTFPYKLEPFEPPLNRIMREGCRDICKVCGSTRAYKWKLWKRTCDQPECPSHGDK